MIGQVEILQKRRGGCGARRRRDDERLCLACFPLMSLAGASCATARLSQGFKMYGVVTLACVYTVNRVLRTMNEAQGRTDNSISRTERNLDDSVVHYCGSEALMMSCRAIIVVRVCVGVRLTPVRAVTRAPVRVYA